MLPLLFRALRLAPVVAPLALLAAVLATPPQAALAQTVPVSAGVWSTRVPVSLRAPATAAGEAVVFSGAGNIITRLATDPTTRSTVLIALFNTNGIVATGAATGTRYVLTAQESLILPHVATQNVTLMFPLEPVAGSRNPAVRVATAQLSFVVDVGTGAVAATTSGGISVQ